MTVGALSVAPTPFRLRLARPTHPVRVSGRRADHIRHAIVSTGRQRPDSWPVPTDQTRPEGPGGSEQLPVAERLLLEGLDTAMAANEERTVMDFDP